MSKIRRFIALLVARLGRWWRKPSIPAYLTNYIDPNLIEVYITPHKAARDVDVSDE